MSLMDLARDVKSGKKKLEDIRPGIRKVVRQFLPYASPAPKPSREVMKAFRESGSVTGKRSRMF